MKLLIKLCVVVSLLICMVYAGGDPHITRQIVRSFPASHDTSGIGFYHYNFRLSQIDPTWYATKTSVGSGVAWNAATLSARWYVEEANVAPAEYPWQAGDTCLTICGWDIEYDNNPATYGDNPLHTGYCALFSDTLVSTVATQDWKADDTLRIMTEPTASWYGGLVDVSIANPKETDHAPWGAFAYDVAGYWLVSDTTGTGTPNSMDVVIGYFPVTGGYGDYTICTYDPAEVWGHGGTYDVVHAYYIVPRRSYDASHTIRSWYMSQNSNWYVIVDTQEDEKTPTSCAVFTAPVFRHSTAIRYTLPNQTHVTLKIYNTSGQLVQTLVDGVKAAGEHTVTFDANKLSSGVYFYQFETAEKTMSGKLVVLR